MTTLEHFDLINDSDTLTFLDRAETLGFTLEQQKQLLGLVLLEKLGKLKRTFSFSDPVEEVEAACTPAFARGFAHVDWVDGESVVQAEQSTGEDGFNWRFHRIEDDLDALAQDTAKAFACLAELREQVAKALSEVKGAVNAINSDIYACCGHGSATTPGVYIPQPLPQPYPYPYPFPQPGPWTPGVPGGFPGGIPGGGVTDPGPLVWLAGVQPGTWAYFHGGVGEIGGDINPRAGAGLPVDAVLAGMPATYVTRDVVMGRDVDVWSTPAGLLLMDPATASPAAGATKRAPYRDPEVDRAAGLARWIEGAGARITKAFGARGFTKTDVLATFGDEELGDGRTVATLLAGLDARERFKTPHALQEAAVSAGAQRIAASGRGQLALAGSLGLAAKGDAAHAAPLGALAALPAKAREALVGAGIGTLGELAGAAPKHVRQLLERAGVTADAGDVAAWQATAAVLTKV